ncbi:MAG: hypothetical protein JSU85_07660 [Candidatus Zixiibacteriota bacterium]|nr:MAG: hypothetical protein JSU85_07660 [candidate division Zixibacteria bacterium]
MKILLKILLIFPVTFSITLAQYSGQLSIAETVLKGTSIGSGFVAVYEDGFGVIGQYRVGFGGYSDIGGKAGIVDYDKGDQTGFFMGVDYKYQIMEVRIQDPVDMSIGGLVDFAHFEHFSLLSFGGFLAGSHPYRMSSGRKITPYGRLILRIDREDPDNFDPDTDFNIGLNFGGALELSSSTNAHAEFQLDNIQTAFFMGVSFGL